MCSSKQSHVLAWVEKRNLRTPARSSAPLPPAPIYTHTDMPYKAARGDADNRLVSERFGAYLERIGRDARVQRAVESEFGQLVVQYRNIRRLSQVCACVCLPCLPWSLTLCEWGGYVRLQNFVTRVCKRVCVCVLSRRRLLARLC